MENQIYPFLVIGLGNPGREYRETRHNIGFIVIDRLCKAMGISLSRMQSKALVGMGSLEGCKLVVAKPQTFMNLSGQSVGGLVRFYKVPLAQVIVAHDDLDLPLGTIRLRPGGGSAGQKGMASIIQQLGTQEFARLRLGIGRPPGQMDPAAYVLQRFTAKEQDMLNLVLDRSEAAVRSFVREGLNTAMNLHNGSLQEK
ncbi:MAG: aminoacyl-tRNA hydrolase [Anaerolineaceae bacterium]|nr:aminoacyl-tRNA hydrolase [Anaerolineaceae bacterium]